MTRILKALLRWFLILGFSGLLLIAAAAGVAYWLLAPRLPSVAVLKDYHMQVPLRVLTADGKLIATFGETRRIPVAIDQVPDMVKHAVLSAEDADFYTHPGVDWRGVMRAGFHVVASGGNKTQGGSTITQQVARNFFLSPQKLYSRKLIEMFIALRMENELSKDQILELYLNKMFLGHRSYGVAAAAEYYYGKRLDQLTVAQCAALASTFQLPSAVNPLTNTQRLIARRNWVLGQMLEHKYINRAQYDQAMQAPDDAAPHEQPIQVDAPYLAEMARVQALDRLGNDALTEGYVVKTTLVSTRQQAAVAAVRDGLAIYDHRHGWRGPEAHEELPPGASEADYSNLLSSYNDVAGLTPGLVIASSATEASVYLPDRKTVKLDLAAVSWAHPYINETRVGAEPKTVNTVLKPGDIIRLIQDDKGNWQLTQIPKAQAALVSLNPEDGAIQSLVGGFNFQRSKFNRAVMAARQPGSSFKPFIYSAAFERGFTAASIINDAPLALPDPSQPNGLWTPSNDDNKFSGPMRLREALVESKNLVSVRLLDAIGVRYARDYVTRFGFPLDALPNNLSMALGTASVSPLSMARGFAVFANGGYLVTPYFIGEIDDRDGKAVYVANPARACADCQARLLQNSPPAPPPASMLTNGVAASSSSTPAPSSSTPAPATSAALTAETVLPADAHNGAAAPVLAPHVIDIRNDYLVTSLMKDVIQSPQGTGYAAKVLNRPDLAGKTGSTNDHRDAWFVGFNGDLSAAVWVGFDDFTSLGKGEFGAKAALPIWIDYMGEAVKSLPENAIPMPPGITTVQINRENGLPTAAGDPDAMSEIFKVEDVDRLHNQALQQQQQNQDQQQANDIF